MAIHRSVRARLAAVAVLSALVGAACGGGGQAELGDPTTLATTSTSTIVAPTTTVAGPKAPLTGLVVSDAAVLTRPALAIKVDNIDSTGCETARPQIGLDHADLVYEILVEGITRFMAVFHSDLPETIGPVRSARSSDVDLIAMLGTPLFAWSGNNANVAADLTKVKGRYVDVGHSSAAGSNFYRDSVRCAPHNLLVNPADLFAYAAEKQAGTPTPVFTYRAEGAALPTTAQPTGGVRLTTGQEVVYIWNATTKSWDRIQRGSRHTVVDQKVEVPISPVNVVALEISYVSSSTPGSPQAVTVGTGPASVYTDGQLITGTWSRQANGDPWTLTDTAGTIIDLTPGSTWVALAQKGKVEQLDTAAAAKFIS